MTAIKPTTLRSILETMSKIRVSKKDEDIEHNKRMYEA